MNTKKKIVALVLVMLTVFTMTTSALAMADNSMVVYVTQSTRPRNPTPVRQRKL